MQLDKVQRLLEHMRNSNNAAITEEHIKEFKKKMKKEYNKKYYEENKNRICLKNSQVIVDKYNNDDEFKNKIKSKNREYRLKKKLE